MATSTDYMLSKHLHRAGYIPARRMGSLVGAMPCCTACDSSSNGEPLDGTVVLPDAMATLCGGSSAGMSAAAGADAWGRLDWLGR